MEAAQGAPAHPGDVAVHTEWKAVVTLALATLIVASELTLAAFALPQISSELAVSPAATAWVLLAYTLPLVAMAIPAGRWVDGADIRWVFLLSLGGIGLASGLAALANTFAVLLFARALQGLASALYLSVYMPVVSTTVAVSQRGRAISAIATIMMLGSVALAPLGGWVAESLGWRAVFLVKMPLLLLALCLGYYILPNTKAGLGLTQRLPIPHRALWWEMLLIGAAASVLLAAFEMLARQVAVGLILAVFSLLIFFGWSRLAYSKQVVAMLARPRFGLPILALMLVSAMTGLMSFTLPFFVMEVMGREPGTLSLAMLGFVLAAACVSPLSGTLADRYGALNVATAGAALSVLGLSTLLSLDMGSTGVELALCTAATGLGMGLFNAPNMAAILEASPANATGTASGLSSVARMMGSTLGPAVAALSWNLSGGGIAGLHSGVLALSTLTLFGFMALLVASRTRR